jgi:hypothetical protein
MDARSLLYDAMFMRAAASPPPPIAVVAGLRRHGRRRRPPSPPTPGLAADVPATRPPQSGPGGVESRRHLQCPVNRRRRLGAAPCRVGEGPQDLRRRRHEPSVEVEHSFQNSSSCFGCAVASLTAHLSIVSPGIHLNQSEDLWMYLFDPHTSEATRRLTGFSRFTAHGFSAPPL